MILLHLDNDPPISMTNFDRVMFGMHQFEQRRAIRTISQFAPVDLRLVNIMDEKYHPLAIVMRMPYQQACIVWGIQPYGIHAQACGFWPQVPEQTVPLRWLRGGREQMPATWRAPRTFEIDALNFLWRAEFDAQAYELTSV